MKIFEKIISYFLYVPDWVPLIVLPALVIVLAILFACCGGRKAFFPLAVALVFAGTVLIYVRDRVLSPVYFGLFVLITALFSLLLLIPGRKDRKKEKKADAEALFEKFYQPLTEKPFTETCEMESESVKGTAEENGMRLQYAESLVKKLQGAKLTAGDRLETEELSRRIATYRDKPLTETEINALNDCLASVLKLTAKYSL